MLTEPIANSIKQSRKITQHRFLACVEDSQKSLDEGPTFPLGNNELSGKTQAPVLSRQTCRFSLDTFKFARLYLHFLGLCQFSVLSLLLEQSL